GDFSDVWDIDLLLVLQFQSEGDIEEVRVLRWPSGGPDNVIYQTPWGKPVNPRIADRSTDVDPDRRWGGSWGGGRRGRRRDDDDGFGRGTWGGVSDNAAQDHTYDAAEDQKTPAEKAGGTLVLAVSLCGGGLRAEQGGQKFHRAAFRI
ncbi:MAG: hypothetical protein QXP27_03880, partial [Candidatus Methanomethyliaceae archaeon]